MEPYDEGTLDKVYKGLEAAGLDYNQSVDVVNQIQNQGVLFRERGKVAFQTKARILVCNFFNDNSEKTDDYILTLDKVYVVWFSKTLQNWKALVSTTVPDGMYYEVTYDGDEEVTYIDAYKKFKNVAVPD